MLEKYNTTLKILIAGNEYKNKLIQISWIVKEGKGNTLFEELLEVTEPPN